MTVTTATEPNPQSATFNPQPAEAVVVAHDVSRLFRRRFDSLDVSFESLEGLVQRLERQAGSVRQGVEKA